MDAKWLVSLLGSVAVVDHRRDPVLVHLGAGMIMYLGFEFQLLDGRRLAKPHSGSESP
ncbi:MAG TPA: hypothetical protein VGR35_09110 [Tepidisphaeraceae bacterium]|nr:hypothetical protein [Tepidisphaeraceae bacterium]